MDNFGKEVYMVGNQAIYRGWLSQNEVRLPVREPIKYVKCLRAMNPKYLARTHFGGKQYELLTSSMTESMYSCLKTARKLHHSNPI